MKFQIVVSQFMGAAANLFIIANCCIKIFILAKLAVTSRVTARWPSTVNAPIFEHGSYARP